MQYLILIIVAAALVIVLALGVRRVTVFEYEKGLKYAKGKFRSVLDPGQYWHVPFFTSIQKVDVRTRFVSITGQEVLSADGVGLKVSLAANFAVADPSTALNKIECFHDALYLELQIALREIIGAVDIDTLLSERHEISRKLTEATGPRVEALGLKLVSVDLKDIMFPGKLKEMFAQVVSARKEGLAALERARGETAALRNLANAAKLIEGNPNLLQLRLIQTLGEASGNTFIVGMPTQSSFVPIPRETDAKQIGGDDPEGPERPERD